ncbi:MAG: hypothetical protein U5R30_02255 [Deltaproteobacteria bacterium]|nr:hypothetical protein [Deltaproteobacteria bacterium]
MVTVQDIRHKFLDCEADGLGKDLFIDGKLLRRQRVEAGTRIGHDIAYARHGKIQLAFTKADKATTSRVNSRKPGNPFAGHAGNEKILA